MVSQFFSKFFGSRNDRQLKQLRKVVEKINALEDTIKALSDVELAAKTQEYRQRLDAGESLDSLIPEAFATVREASSRVLDMRHFDEQLIGGLVLHQGKISEMRTGEGKTLVATLPSYLNALTGKGVHVITVNDYLAQRDAEWMGQIHQFLGMTVGVILSGQSYEEKKAAYDADITYGTNNEYGFDYLRDNMAFSMEEKVQRGLHFAIVDEVDSILIDEARTPLIISGPAEDNAKLYIQINQLIPHLKRQKEGEGEDKGKGVGEGDFFVDEKDKQIHLTEDGHELVEKLLVESGLLKENESLYDATNISLMHHINASLRAHHLFQRDVDYIIKNNEIVIIDEFTGRAMPGRRWSEGLHQSIEAKEGVTIQLENQTLASITFQNYFRLYEKLSGMTGTADTEAYEFQQIYNLEVLVIPTHLPVKRKDFADLIYLTVKEKFAAIVEDIRDCQKRGQPVLVGTVSIEVSEYLAKVLKKENIKHAVLNAKQHGREADIVAQAGRPGMVTIATNMAGRGTDIVLGGNFEVELKKLGKPKQETIDRLREEWEKRNAQVKESGGLHIIGTERHESRRIDNQLRGRAGRQGDPGSSRFYLSMEDSLMRIFASEKVAGLMKKLGMQEGEAIEHKWVSRSIENAQRKVEGHNFDIRKNLLEFDDVANDQRKVIYQQRDELMSLDDISDIIHKLQVEVLNHTIDQDIPPESLEEQWDIEHLETVLKNDWVLTLPLKSWLEEDDNLNENTLRERIIEAMQQSYAEKEQQFGTEALRKIEKGVMLQILDTLWKEHLAAMDYLRKGIGLRGYAQKNPKQEYKRESFELFEDMLERLKRDVVLHLAHIQVISEEDIREMEAQHRAQGEMEYHHDDIEAGSMDVNEEKNNADKEGHQPYVREGQKVGRNDPCPCGSGKKYKQCHGRLS